MLLHSVSNLSCSAKCIQAFSFELTPLLKKYWTLIQKVYSTFICQYKIFNFNLIFEAWISKHTIVQHQSCIEMSFMELMWESQSIQRRQQHSALDSGVRMSDIQHWTELLWLMVLWLTDSSPHCCKVWSRGAELSVRGDSLLWAWPGRTAGRQPAVSAPRLAHNWANRDHVFLKNMGGNHIQQR